MALRTVYSNDGKSIITIAEAAEKNASSSSSRTKNMTYTKQQREELTEMARILRRMKRRILLKSVEQPVTPLDGFREQVLRIAASDSNSNENHNKDMAMASSSSGSPYSRLAGRDHHNKSSFTIGSMNYTG